MDVLRNALGLGTNFLKKKKKQLEDAANTALDLRTNNPNSMSIRQQVNRAATDQNFRDQFNLFSQMQKTNTPVKPFNSAARFAGNILGDTARGTKDFLRFAAFAGIQTPVLGATQGRVNIPVYSDAEVREAAGEGSLGNRVKASTKSTFNRFFVPAANAVTLAKKPLDVAISGGIGATTKVLENKRAGKEWSADIGTGVAEGAKNSWILGVSNSITNKVLGKFAPQFTDEALATAWKGATSAKQLASMAGKQISRGILETPAETVGFTGWDVMKGDKGFQQALQDNLISSLIGNIGFHGGGSAVRIGSKGMQRAIGEAVEKTVREKAKDFNIPKIDLDNLKGTEPARSRMTPRRLDLSDTKTDVVPDAPKVDDLITSTKEQLKEPKYPWRKPTPAKKMYQDDIDDFDVARDILSNRKSSAEEKAKARSTVDLLMDHYFTKAEINKIGTGLKKQLNALAKKATASEGVQGSGTLQPAYGLAAGADIDEQGNVDFNEERALAGLAVMGGVKTKQGRQVMDTVGNVAAKRVDDLIKGAKGTNVPTKPADAAIPTVEEIVKNGRKQRGFPKTVSENLGTPEEVAKAAVDNPENYYNPLANKTVVERVQKNILSQGEDAALNIARTGKDTDANATAMLLIDDYIKKGDFEKANQLIRDVSPRFTEQGQGIQILSLYGKLTPTGALRFTQKLIDEANQNLAPDKQITLNKDNVKQITDMATKLQGLPEGSRERLVATAELFDTMRGYVPPSLGQKLSTLQTMAQLLNPKTLVRNTVGNVGFAALENVKDVVATPVDMAVGAFTGKRTKTLPSFRTQAAGAGRGFVEGVEDALKGIDTSAGDSTKFDLPTRTFRGGILGGLEKTMNISLRATDRAMYTAARDESLRQQMSAAKLAEPTEDMIRQAHVDGLYRTFQDDTKLAEVLSGFKKLLNKPTGGEFGLGDLIIKYPRTPANLLQRGLDYSPAGLVGTAMDIYKGVAKGNFDQRHFVESLSRATVGTGIIALGYAMGKAGIITGEADEDKDIRAAQKETGQGAFKFNKDAFMRWVTSGFNAEQAKPKAGDTTFTYDWFQPNSFMISMGANAAKPGEGDDQLTQFMDALASAEEGLTNQPLVQGLLRFPQKVTQKGFTQAIAETAADLPASFVPSTVNQIGQVMDNTARETYDPSTIKQGLNKAMSRIPGLRQKLPARINVEGQEMEQFQDGGNTLFNVFLNPSFVSKIKDDPELGEVLRLFEATDEVKQAPKIADKKLTINGEEKKLNPQEYQQYQTYIGQQTERLYNEMIASPKYQMMSDTEKVDALSSILTDVNAAAKAELFGHEQENMSRRAKGLIAEGFTPQSRASGATTPNIPTGGASSTPGGATANATEVDRYIKAYELDKYMDGSGTGIAKYKNQQKMWQEVRKMYSDDEAYADMPPEVKSAIYEKLGVKEGEIEYDYIASQDFGVKYPYITETLDALGEDHDALITALQEGRVESVSGDRMITDGVLDQLYEDGYISNAEKKALKKFKLTKDGKLAGGRGSGKGDGLTKTEINKLISDAKAAAKDLTNPPNIDTSIPKDKSGGGEVRVPQIKVDPTFDVRMPAIPNVNELIQKIKLQAPRTRVAEARNLVSRTGVGTTGGGRNIKLSQSFYRGGR